MKTEAELISETWMKYMRSGNFEAAWKLSDRLLALGLNRDYERIPRHYQSIWDGSPLHGKRVLIRCYHGLGDSIQYIRYAPLVRKIASSVSVWAPPSLIGLFKTAKGIDTLLPLHDGVPQVAYDVDVEIMELAHIFRTVVSRIPAEIPYLHVNPFILPGSGQDFSVGLVWRAGDWDHGRNVPFSLLQPLFAVKGARIFILQENPEEAGWRDGWGVYAGRFSLFDYARAIRGLDLLIAIDTMPAHLAGALNTPVWVMLKAGADWRWMEGRDSSPWYPSMKLFRQKREGDWRPVVESVVEELKSFVARRM